MRQQGENDVFLAPKRNMVFTDEFWILPHLDLLKFKIALVEAEIFTNSVLWAELV